MTLNEFFSAIAGISGLLFVVTSMLAMSLSLSVQQMTQPLKNARAGNPGAAGELRAGAVACLCHHKADPPRPIPADRGDFAGDSRRSALHS